MSEKKTLELNITTQQAQAALEKMNKETQKLRTALHEFGLSEEQLKIFDNTRKQMSELVKQQEKYNLLKKTESELEKVIQNTKDKNKKDELKKGLEQIKSQRKGLLKSGEGVVDEDQEKKKQKIQEDTLKNLKKGWKTFEKDALQVFNTLGINIKSVFSDVVKELSSMLDGATGMASYALGSSLFTNAAAREQAMKYGLSDSQNYALTQAMSMLNMRSDEDLMYINSAQKEKFNRLMDQYNNWYTKMESSGLLRNVQEAQLEFKMMKQEIAYKLLDWFAKHRDQIMTALEVIMKAVEVIANVILAILNAIPGTNRYSSGVDASVVSGGVTNNINVNNTNNATAMLNNKEELQQSFNNSNQNLVKQIGASLLAKM